MSPRIIIATLVLFAIPTTAAATEIGPPAPSPDVAVAQPSKGDSAVRYRRAAPRVQTDDSLGARVREARRRAEADKADDRPTELSDIEMAERAARVEAAGMEITDEKIVKLRELLRVTAIESPEYPDLLMRLADLHLEKKAYFERQAGALAQPIWEAEHGVAPSLPMPTTVAPATPAARPVDARTGDDDRPRRRHGRPGRRRGR